MVIFLFEGLLLIILLRLLPGSWLSVCAYTLFWALSWSIICLILFHLELAHTSPDGLYGSDERYYYEAMLSTLEAGTWWPLSDVCNKGFVAFGAAVLRMSPNDSVIWVELANIGLFMLCLALGFYILKSWGISKNVAYIIMLLAGTNGIITWMVIRNLKDTLFLFLTLLLIVLITYILSENRQTSMAFRLLGVLAVGIVFSQILESIRQWGPYWTLVIIVAAAIETCFKRRYLFLIVKRNLFFILITCLFLTIGLHTILYKSVTQDLFIFISYAAKSGGLVGAGLMDITLSFPRFLIGPGPIRSIFGHDVFLFTTSVGNLLITLGSIMWWSYIPILVLAFLRGPNYWFKYASVIIPLLIFVVVYTFAYAGSVETRFRAIVYMLSFIGSAPYLNSVIKYEKNYMFLTKYAVIAIIVWVSGTIVSVISMGGIL